MKMCRGGAESIDVANAVILFVLVFENYFSVSELAGMLDLLTFQWLFYLFDPTCPFQVQPLCGQGS